MPDGGDADGLPVVGELVDDAIGADAQGAQAPQAAMQRVANVRVALEQAEPGLGMASPESASGSCAR